MVKAQKLLTRAETDAIFAVFAKLEPHPKTELVAPNPFALLIAIVLSAQATDVSVNKATVALFKKADTPQKLLKLGEGGLKDYIKTIGLYRGKAKNVIALSKILVESHGGKVPKDREALQALPGVGRKRANVILGNAFDIPGITVDTHFGRLVRRWRWTDETDPVKVEKAVGELIERSEWTLLSHRVIFHGRRVCHARRPACGICVVARECPSFGLGPTEPLIAAALVRGPETDHLLALAGM